MKVEDGYLNNFFLIFLKMKINKKAIMIKFLVTLLLAIIIFAPACMFASKFFQLSGQAKDNFVDFVNEIKGIEKTQLGERKNFILIIDKPTALVYFEPNKNQVRVDVDANCVITCSDYHFVFEKPGQCEEDKGCLCLFREVEYDVPLTENWFSVKPVSAICESFDINLKLNDCSIGVPEDVNSYSCSDGFAIERHVADEASWRVDAFFKAPRRISLTLEKRPHQINIYSNNAVEIPDEPFEGEGGSFGGGGAGGTH